MVNGSSENDKAGEENSDPRKSEAVKSSEMQPEKSDEEIQQDDGEEGEEQDIKEIIREEVGEVEQDVVEIAARDVERSDYNEARLAKEKADKSDTFYSNLIYTIANLRYDEKAARLLWVNLLSHKMEMSDQMDRNVGIRVASLDYFRNILGALDEVKIMDASRYIETAQLAVTDGLTNVFNHRYFQDRLLRDMNRANDEGGKLSLLMIDIDNFKKYNDINGHIAGDVALKEVASVLRRNLKRDDLVARYGGEEFVVILVGLDGPSALVVAERIRRRIVERDFPNEQVLPGGQLTVSIGLADFPGDSRFRSELIAAADRALYQAKNTGKNKVVSSPKNMRSEVRIPIAKGIHYRHSRAQPEGCLDSLSLNLSMSGLCMSAAQKLELDDVLYLDLVEGNGDEAITVMGRVIWVKPYPNGQNQVGIRFVDIGLREAEYLKKMVGNYNG